MSDLLLTLEKLKSAQVPEEVFGLAGGDVDIQASVIKQGYRHLAKVVHADLNGQDTANAHEATVLLNHWLQVALAQARRGEYGTGTRETPTAAITLTSKVRTYTLAEPLCAGDLCNLYRATYEESVSKKNCIAKIVREACDNAAIAKEAVLLKSLAEGAGTSNFSRYFLPPIDCFGVQDGGIRKRVLILPEADDAFTLANIHQRYAEGVDLRHMVWMWKRILSVIGFAHRHGIVHGAVLPPHVLMRPGDHGAYLIDWMGASKEGRATVISSQFADWYPTEVLELQRIVPATDIYLAAKCAIYLLGGDPVVEVFPETVPARMVAFIKTCLFKIPTRRPQDAWELHAEFDETIVRPLFGAPRFIDFSMS